MTVHFKSSPVHACLLQNSLRAMSLSEWLLGLNCYMKKFDLMLSYVVIFYLVCSYTVYSDVWNVTGSTCKVP